MTCGLHWHLNLTWVLVWVIVFILPLIHDSCMKMISGTIYWKFRFHIMSSWLFCSCFCCPFIKNDGITLTLWQSCTFSRHHLILSIFVFKGCESNIVVYQCMLFRRTCPPTRSSDHHQLCCQPSTELSTSRLLWMQLYAGTTTKCSKVYVYMVRMKSPTSKR